MGNFVIAAASKYQLTIQLNDNIYSVTTTDAILSRESWQNIICNKTRAYIEMKDHPEFHASSCIAWFYDWWISMSFSELN